MHAIRTAFVLLFLLSLVLSPATALGQPAALVTLQPPASAPASGSTFTTDVTISGAQAVLGFQFDLNFDPAMLAVQSIELGPWLGSAGRSARPLGPDTRAAAEGRVVFGGFTLGDQPGASGDGLLATITWQALKDGESQVSLAKLQLAGSAGTALPSAAGDAVAVAVGDSGAPAQAETPTPVAEPAPTPAPAAASQPTSGLPTWAIAAVAAIVLAVIVIWLLRRRRAPRSDQQQSRYDQ